MPKLILTMLLWLYSQTVFSMDGGIRANPSLYPGQVMISYNRLVTNLLVNPLNNCSGVVLDNRHILTTASCVYFLDTDSNPDSFRPITPAALYVHPSNNGVVGKSRSSFPIITPNDQPNIRVASYVVHPLVAPDNPPFYSPPTKYSYNLAILTLTNTINVPAATLYHGKENFLGNTAIALGWDQENRRIQTSPFSVSFEYFHQLELYSTTILENPPTSASPCSVSLFCAGYSSTVKNLNSSYDKSAPMYRNVNGKRVIIGLAVAGSNGTSSPKVERYSYVNSAMYEFIKNTVPKTKFWSEKGLEPVFAVNSPVPVWLLLLLNDE